MARTGVAVVADHAVGDKVARASCNVVELETLAKGCDFDDFEFGRRLHRLALDGPLSPD